MLPYWNRVLRWQYPVLSRWALNTIPCILVRRRQRDIRHTHREGSHVKVEAETERCSHKSRNVGSYQKEVGRREQILPLSLQRDIALTTPWFQPNENWLQTSDLQNGERINFCSSKSSSLWWFVTAAKEINMWSLSLIIPQLVRVWHAITPRANPA